MSVLGTRNMSQLPVVQEVTPEGNQPFEESQTDEPVSQEKFEEWIVRYEPPPCPIHERTKKKYSLYKDCSSRFAGASI